MNDPKRNPRTLLPAAAVLLALLCGVLLPGCREPAPTEPAAVQTAPALPTAPTIPEPDPIDLGQGLVIERVDRYSGIYMEDGSNEIVQDVMMLLVRSDAPQDLQLARIEADCGTFTARFEVTNLPAGARAVLLEQSRRTADGQEPLTCTAQNVVFFPEPMALQEERIGVQGTDGALQVTNLTDAPIPGPVCVYYKNSAADMFYGGITYRTSLPGGLAAGETVTIHAGHYSPESCRIVQVTSGD